MDADVTDDDLLRKINLRDLGGFRTCDGGLVRRGLVFRSAALTDLAGVRLAAVRALGIRTVIDLRRNAERETCPTPWQAMGCSNYWARDHDYSEADHLARVRRADFSADDSRATMISMYSDLPYEQAAAYRRLFKAIVQGAGPVLFHCAVGKDRTGVAAALILAAIGVVKADVLTDYAATAAFDLDASPHARGWPRRPREHVARLAPLLTTDAAYLDAMFDGLRQRSGTIEAYLTGTLALDRDAPEALRRRLVEPPSQL